MNVFDLFAETDYEILKIQRSTTFGNKIAEKLGGRSGVFRNKSGMKRGSTGEVYSESATLLARVEDFYFEPVGNGVRIAGADWEIVSSVDGMNYDTGEIEHLKLTLERAEFYDSDER